MTCHTQHRYEECYSKVLLENIYPEQFHKIILSDCPDLRINDIGIEVVDCTPRDIQEALNLWLKIPKESKQFQERDKERMEKLGYPYTKGLIFWKGFKYTDEINESPLQYVLNAVKEKCKKLNQGHYKELEHYYLFIHSPFFVTFFLMNQMVNALANANQGKLSFERIYLLTNDNEIICFFMESKKIDIVSFDDKQREYAVKAKILMGKKRK